MVLLLERAGIERDGNVVAIKYAEPEEGRKGLVVKCVGESEAVYLRGVVANYVEVVDVEATDEDIHHMFDVIGIDLH